MLRNLSRNKASSLVVSAFFGRASVANIACLSRSEKQFKRSIASDSVHNSCYHQLKQFHTSTQRSSATESNVSDVKTLIEEIRNVIPANARCLNYDTSAERTQNFFSLASRAQKHKKMEGFIAELSGLKMDTSIDVLLALYYFHQFGGDLEKRHFFDNVLSSIDHAILLNGSGEGLSPLLYHLKGMFLQKYARDVLLPTYKQDQAIAKCKEGVQCYNVALELYEKRGILTNPQAFSQQELDRYYNIHSDTAILNLWLSNMFKSMAFIRPNNQFDDFKDPGMEEQFQNMLHQQFSQETVQQNFEKMSGLDMKKTVTTIPEMENNYLKTGELALEHFRKSFSHVKEAKTVYAYASALFLMERPEEAAEGYGMLFENDRKLYNDLKVDTLQKESTVNYALSLFHLGKLAEARKVLSDTLKQYPNEAPLAAFVLHLEVEENPQLADKDATRVLEDMKKYYFQIEQIERESLRGDISHVSYDPRQLQFFKGLCYAYLSQMKGV